MSLIFFCRSKFRLISLALSQRSSKAIDRHLHDLEPAKYLYVDDDSESIRNIFH